MTGPIHGISSRIFFFILFIRAVLFAVIENLCDSSRAFWMTISSGVHLSNKIGSLVDEINISSSLLAIEQRGISVSRIVCFTSLFCEAINIPSQIPESALESCHFPPSIIMR